MTKHANGISQYYNVFLITVTSLFLRILLCFSSVSFPFSPRGRFVLQTLEGCLDLVGYAQIQRTSNWLVNWPFPQGDPTSRSKRNCPEFAFFGFSCGLYHVVMSRYVFQVPTSVSLIVSNLSAGRKLLNCLPGIQNAFFHFI